MNDRYQSPLSERYASKEMQYIFSPDMKFRTWRKLWIALAETEKELGLNITQEQIDELKAHAEDINYDVAKEREKIVRHDVMSHVYAYGVQCPKAKGIIHLGATSCYVGDNTDIIVMAEALKLVRKKLVNVIAELAKYTGPVVAQWILSLATLGLAIAGIVFFIKGVKNVSLEKSRFDISAGNVRVAAYLNVGIIILYAVMTLSFIASLELQPEGVIAGAIIVM